MIVPSDEYPAGLDTGLASRRVAPTRPDATDRAAGATSAGNHSADDRKGQTDLKHNHGRDAGREAAAALSAETTTRDDIAMARRRTPIRPL